MLREDDLGFRVAPPAQARHRLALGPIVLMLIVLIGAWLVAIDAFAR